MANYEKGVRPVRDWRKPTTVAIDVIIYAILSVVSTGPQPAPLGGRPLGVGDHGRPSHPLGGTVAIQGLRVPVTWHRPVSGQTMSPNACTAAQTRERGHLCVCLSRPLWLETHFPLSVSWSPRLRVSAVRLQTALFLSRPKLCYVRPHTWQVLLKGCCRMNPKPVMNLVLHVVLSLLPAH